MTILLRQLKLMVLRILGAARPTARTTPRIGPAQTDSAPPEHRAAEAPGAHPPLDATDSGDASADLALAPRPSSSRYKTALALGLLLTAEGRLGTARAGADSRRRPARRREAVR